MSTKQQPAGDTVAKPGRRPADYFGLILRGMAMGASDIVPGVSGGTMAFILGIYEELIQSIRDVAQPPFIKAVLSFRVKDALTILNWQFLLSVATGILLAALTLSRVLEWLLLNQAVYLWSFFFGLVIASIFVVGKRIPRWTVQLGGAVAVGALGAYILVGLVPAQTPNDWWFLILSGAIAICAMVLPGVSGAFILVLLGKYQYVLSAVNDKDILTVAFVGLGAGLGIVTFAQVLGWLFKHYHNATIAALMGLMIGSLRKIWPWKEDVAYLLDQAGQRVLDSDGHAIVTQQQNLLPTFAQNGGQEIVLALGLALLGFGAILLLDRLASRSEGA